VDHLYPRDFKYGAGRFFNYVVEEDGATTVEYSPPFPSRNRIKITLTFIHGSNEIIAVTLKRYKHYKLEGWVEDRFMSDEPFQLSHFSFEKLASLRVLSNVHALNAAVPVIVRARDEGDIARLTAAGASEVVPEAFESGLMLASHTLVWMGVPLARVMRRVSQMREQQYGLLRGLYHGASDAPETGESAQPRLHAVTLHAHAAALARPIAELDLEALGVQLRAVRRPGAAHKLSAEEAVTLREGDVVVLLGSPQALAAAELRLLQG